MRFMGDTEGAADNRLKAADKIKLGAGTTEEEGTTRKSDHDRI